MGFCIVPFNCNIPGRARAAKGPSRRRPHQRAEAAPSSSPPFYARQFRRQLLRLVEDNILRGFSNQIIRFPQLANILLAACLLTVPAPALVAWLIFRTVRRRKTPAKSQAQPSQPAFTAGLPGVRR
jgi:hypothetical protein